MATSVLLVIDLSPSLIALITLKNISKIEENS
jgi:hypothetical protein